MGKKYTYKPVGVRKPPPRLIIPSHLLSKMHAYISHAQGEISGLGEVQVLENDFEVGSILLFDQDTTAGSTELKPDSLLNFMEDAFDGGFDLGKIKLWWHSHGNGSVFWSNHDEDNIAHLSTTWMVSVVGNKKGEYLARLDLYQPLQVTLDLSFVTLPSPLSKAQEKAIKEEIAQKVKVVTNPQLPDAIYTPDWSQL